MQKQEITEVHKIQGESRIPAYYELISIFTTILGTLLVVVSFLAGAYAIGTIGTVIVIFGLYGVFFVHSAVVLKNEAGSVTIRTRGGVITLQASDIAWVKKMVRYTFTNRYWVMLKVRQSNRCFPIYYVIRKSQADELLHLFQGMKIQLRNVPE